MKRPFEMNGNFTQIPNAVLRHYQYYPRMNGATALVYAFIYDHYNENYGYSFPTQYQIARGVNMSRQSVISHVQTLVKVGLINARKSQSTGNNVYTLNQPIEDEAEFFRRFPEADAIYRKHVEGLTKQKEGTDAQKEHVEVFGVPSGWL